MLLLQSLTIYTWWLNGGAEQNYYGNFFINFKNTEYFKTKLKLNENIIELQE